MNPADRSALDEALAEATEAGITVVAVDQAVTEESAFVISNDQEEYAYLGASWLFETIGGSGDVVYMRGIAGAAADDDRDAGFQRALEEYPGHQRHLRESTPTGTRRPAPSSSTTSWRPVTTSTASGPRASTT